LNFNERASLTDNPEWMDEPCSYDDLRACLRDISQVNELTGAYRPTLDWLNALYAKMPYQEKPLHIVDVGCGYGDMLRRIHRWAADCNLPVVLTGIDNNPDAIRAAREVTRPGIATFLAGDAFAFEPTTGVDLVVSSLLTHHMENHEVVEFLQWMEATARMGWFVNDLHRQSMPYWLFKAMSRLTRWHRFVKHDGPVSILRSFRVEDWQELCREAGLPERSYMIGEYWPARLCVARLKPAGFAR
jgi:SAM-dependent methyltransferase